MHDNMAEPLVPKRVVCGEKREAEEEQPHEMSETLFTRSHQEGETCAFRLTQINKQTLVGNR